MDIETSGLSPTDSELVAIAVARDKRRSDEYVKQVIHRESCSEKELVDLFVREMKKLDDGSKIVTYNGDTFDWPFLIARSMEFDDYGELNDELFDLKERHGYDLFKDYGRDPDGSYVKLEQLCCRNGIRHQVDCEGGKVPQLFEEEKFGVIRKYAKEDVRITHEVFRKLEVEKDKTRKDGEEQ